MATKSTNFNMRMEPKFKSTCEDLFEGLGMTMPEAINIFLHQAVLNNGLPFDVRYPRGQGIKKKKKEEMKEEE